MVISIILIIIALVAFIISAWFIYRSIGLFNDVRFIADCKRLENSNLKYRRTPTFVIVVIVVFPIIALALLLIGLLVDADFVVSLFSNIE